GSGRAARVRKTRSGSFLSCRKTPHDGHYRLTGVPAAKRRERRKTGKKRGTPEGASSRCVCLLLQRAAAGARQVLLVEVGTGAAAQPAIQALAHVAARRRARGSGRAD